MFLAGSRGFECGLKGGLNGFQREVSREVYGEVSKVFQVVFNDCKRFSMGLKRVSMGFARILRRVRSGFKAFYMVFTCFKCFQNGFKGFFIRFSQVFNVLKFSMVF